MLERLSHYRLIEPLGQGGMGAVFRAEDVRLGRHVALKLLSPLQARDPDARARFLAEARAVSALEHPNICMLYEFDEVDGQPFLAMQLVDGSTLKDALAGGWLSEARTRDVVRAVAAGLAVAHARGIVHRDVKSENVLLGRDGAIKLSDFGIARLVEGAAGLTSASAVIGTPAYVAPEQVMGLRVGPAADQFSLAVVAYECLTGALPFAGGSMAALFHAILNHEPAPPSTRRSGLAPEWDAVFARALAKLPERRYPSVEAFAEAITAVVGDAPAGPGFPVTTTGARPGATESGRTPTPAPRTLAALFFQNLSRDPENDYFCEGITEDLLTDLSKVPGLRVASRNAVERYRGRSVELQTVGRELGVATVLEGGVRRSGARVRITVQLVNVRDGFQIWAERYDRTLEDVFAVQEDIARAIATALRGTLTPDEAAEIRRGRPAEAEAYDLYLKGRELYRRYTPDDNRAALALFERAVALDARYALAWAGIADCCAQFADKRWDEDPAWPERGFEAARRAIEIEPKLSEGHKAEALLWRTRREPERAIAALRRALDADPRSLPALINLGQELLTGGDFAGHSAARSPYGPGLRLRPPDARDRAAPHAALRRVRRVRDARAGGGREPVLHDLRRGAARPPRRSTTAHPTARANSPTAALGVTGAIADAVEALLAARAGEAARALSRFVRLDAEPPAESYGCEIAAAAAAAAGDAGRLARYLREAERIDQRHWAAWRLLPELGALQESAEFRDVIGSRSRAIVWPSEAPPLGADERAGFDSVVESSGLPA